MRPRVLKRLVNPNKVITLQIRSYGDKDGIGNLEETWEDDFELKGVIQRTKVEKKGVEGIYDTATHKGIFETFEIENMQDYRVKEELTTTNGVYTTIYDIINYNPNLFIHGRTHHTELLLRLIPSSA